MLRAYLVDHVNVIDYTYDQWGEIATTESRTRRARIDYKISNVLNFKGEQTVSDKIVTMEDFDISPDAEIEIAGVKYPIRSIQRPKDFSWQYLKVFL